MKKKMFSVDWVVWAMPSPGARAEPLPLTTTCCSGGGSGLALVGVSSAAAARAACLRVLAPDMTTFWFMNRRWDVRQGETR